MDRAKVQAQPCKTQHVNIDVPDLKTLTYTYCCGCNWTRTQWFKNWVVLGSSPVAVTSPSDFVPASSKEFLDIQATIEYGFTLKRVHDMTRTYGQTHTVVYWWDKFQTICKISTYDQLYKEGFYDQQCQTPSGDEQKTNKQNSLYQELLILNYDRHPHPLLQVGGLEN